MPRHERYPTPFLNMSPAALPGLGVVALMFLGMWALFGPFFLIGLLLVSPIVVVAALLIRDRRAKHPASKDLAQLDLESRDEEREHQ